MNSSTKSGFTTLELLTVTMLFGLMAAVAGPKFYASFAATTTRTTADRLARSAELARAAAVWYGRDAELRVDTATKKFWVQVDTTANLTGVKDTIGVVQNLTATRVGMSLNLGGASASSAVLCFDVRGMRSTRSPCQSGSVVVAFALDSRADTVQVTTLGKVLR